MADYYPINSPLINYFFYPAPITQDGPNIPVADGFLYFFDDEDHTVPLPTYSNVINTANPVVNFNPIQLGAAGDCDLFYLENRLYYIVLTGPDGDIENPIKVIEHYNPALGAGGGSGSGNDNYITNGQFSYPIHFWQNTSQEGAITENQTLVAFGCAFICESTIGTNNYVTFQDVSNEDIESDPFRQMVLESINVVTGEATKDFRWIFGPANFKEEAFVTFAIEMINLLSPSSLVTLYLERVFGTDDSGVQANELIEITQFTVTPERKKFVKSFEIPELGTEVLGQGNFCAVRLRSSLSQVCKIGYTNAQLRPGDLVDPVYQVKSIAQTKSEILGVATIIGNAGNMEDYCVHRYRSGQYFEYCETGSINLAPTTIATPFREKCDGSSRTVNGYSSNGIPYQRLYNVIGDQFGEAGDLIVTATNNTVLFTAGKGARAKSAYSAGTSGFVMAELKRGLDADLDCAITDSDQITVTWADMFAPQQIATNQGAQWKVQNGLLGNWYNPYQAGSPIFPNYPLTVSTITPGGPSEYASAAIKFLSTNMPDYRYYLYQIPGSIPLLHYINFLEYATFAHNSRSVMFATPLSGAIFTTVDGSSINLYPGIIGWPYQYAIVDFKSALSLYENMKIFVRTVANPFEYLFTINAIPAASSYILFSSKTVDYYGWYEVDGVGTDPAIVDRTGVKIAVVSSTVEDVAQKTADALNSYTFSLPASADLPALVTDSKVDWYIHL